MIRLRIASSLNLSIGLSLPHITRLNSAYDWPQVSLAPSKVEASGSRSFDLTASARSSSFMETTPFARVTRPYLFNLRLFFSAVSGEGPPSSAGGDPTSTSSSSSSSASTLLPTRLYLTPEPEAVALADCGVALRGPTTCLKIQIITIIRIVTIIQII